ncbi:thiamine phosphate synthase [Paracoccus sp. Z330]|uniref:Thiamine phosphate synthase n=1 Tax=Paracoccus onchidii TaxID=3017813 RepID=A0ABT4ZK73_9RHOB|nr:thiamine phosphate synthase [Paracoccus onchidii]MDB6179477.1 thiamine phosphate synthase [Paracoccus onchidii]
MTLSRFYPIFDHPDWLRLALPAGVRLVQMRLKDLPASQVRAFLGESLDLCRAAGATMVVNDHWQDAIDLGCDWVHLGQEDLDDADLGALRRHDIRLGVSTHDKAELDRARSVGADYIALGPVWPTILKKMKWREQGLERLAQWRQLCGTTPLVAIGGLSVARAPSAFAAGADIVSVVTDITLNPDPVRRIREWQGVTE